MFVFKVCKDCCKSCFPCLFGLSSDSTGAQPIFVFHLFFPGHYSKFVFCQFSFGKKRDIGFSFSQDTVNVFTAYLFIWFTYSSINPDYPKTKKLNSTGYGYGYVIIQSMTAFGIWLNFVAWSHWIRSRISDPSKYLFNIMQPSRIFWLSLILYKVSKNIFKIYQI